MIFKSIDEVKNYSARYPLEELRLSHSTMQTYQSCPRKFEFSKLYNNPKYEESTATRCGTALHEGFQTYLIERNVDSAIWKMMLAYPWEHGISPMKDRSAESCYATLIEMIDKFDANRYELAYIQDSNGNNIPCVEVPFRIDFKGHRLLVKDAQGNIAKECPVYYVGYMDLVVYDKELGEFLVIDIKTTTDKSEDQSAKFAFSNQCTPYSLVIDKILGLPKGSLKVGYFVAGISSSEPKAQMFTFYKSEDDLKDWAVDMEVSLMNIETNTANAYFPRCGGASCVAYGRRCKYFDLCHSRDNDYIMRSLFYEGEQEEPKEFEPLVTINLDLAELY